MGLEIVREHNVREGQNAPRLHLVATPAICLQELRSGRRDRPSRKEWWLIGPPQCQWPSG
jgi:hypothetical protein